MGPPLALIALSLVGFDFFPADTTGRLLAWLGLAAGLLLTGRAWWHRRRNKARAKSAPSSKGPNRRAAKEQRPDTDPVHAHQAAAVCFRRRGERLEFLLVRSSAGSRRLLPKGNVDKGEELWQAAEREAGEEAGVEGRIERQPLTTFWQQGNGGEWAIAAFLLEVTRRTGKGERKRDPKWYSPKKADEALRKNRSAKEADEWRRVLQLATEQLDSP